MCRNCGYLLHEVLIKKEHQACRTLFWNRVTRHTLVLHPKLCKSSRSNFWFILHVRVYNNRGFLRGKTVMVLTFAALLHHECKNIYLRNNRKQHVEGFSVRCNQTLHFPKAYFHLLARMCTHDEPPSQCLGCVSHGTRYCRRDVL